MKPRSLTPAQASYIRRAVKIRRNLTNKKLSAKFGLSEAAITRYAYKRHKEVTKRGNYNVVSR